MPQNTITDEARKPKMLAFDCTVWFRLVKFCKCSTCAVEKQEMSREDDQDSISFTYFHDTRIVPSTQRLSTMIDSANNP